MTHRQKAQFGLTTVFAIVFFSAVVFVWWSDRSALAKRLYESQLDAKQQQRLRLAWEVRHKYKLLFHDEIGLSSAPPDFDMASVREIQQYRDELNEELELRGLLKSSEWGIPRTAE